MLLACYRIPRLSSRLICHMETIRLCLAGYRSGLRGGRFGLPRGWRKTGRRGMGLGREILVRL